MDWLKIFRWAYYGHHGRSASAEAENFLARFLFVTVALDFRETATWRGALKNFRE